MSDDEYEFTSVQDFCMRFDESPLLDACKFRRTVVGEIEKEVKQILGMQKVVTHLNGLLMGDKNMQKQPTFDLVILESKEIDEIIRCHIRKVKKTRHITCIWAMLKIIEPDEIDDWVSKVQRKLYGMLYIDEPRDGKYYWSQVYIKICDLPRNKIAQCKNNWITADDISKLAEKYAARLLADENDETDARAHAAEKKESDSNLLADEKDKANAREVWRDQVAACTLFVSMIALLW